MIQVYDSGSRALFNDMRGIIISNPHKGIAKTSFTHSLRRALTRHLVFDEVGISASLLHQLRVRADFGDFAARHQSNRVCVLHSR
jgi:hypothetical protein